MPTIPRAHRDPIPTGSPRWMLQDEVLTESSEGTLVPVVLWQYLDRDWRIIETPTVLSAGPSPAVDHPEFVSSLNVAVTDHQAAARSGKRNRRDRAPRTTHKTLVIDPMKNVLGHEGRARGRHQTRAAHLPRPLRHLHRGQATVRQVRRHILATDSRARLQVARRGQEPERGRAATTARPPYPATGQVPNGEDINTRRRYHRRIVDRCARLHQGMILMRRAGFTLTELMIAPLIIGIIAAAGIPNAIRARIGGNDNAVQVILGALPDAQGSLLQYAHSY